MMMDSSKQKVFKELFEAINKGIDLLANENLDKILYDAFEKYADSTIKMVNEAYNNGCMPYFSASNILYRKSNYMNPINDMSMLNSAMKVYLSDNQSVEYKEKLKNLLHKLVDVAKMVVDE